MSDEMLFINSLKAIKAFFGQEIKADEVFDLSKEEILNLGQLIIEDFCQKCREKILLTKEEEEIFRKALVEREILETIEQSQDKATAIRAVRRLLRDTFPGLSQLPARYVLNSPVDQPILPPPSAEFWVAKVLADCFWGTKGGLIL